MAVVWKTSCKKCSIRGEDMQSVFEFLISIINDYHINGLRQFEMILSPNN